MPPARRLSSVTLLALSACTPRVPSPPATGPEAPVACTSEESDDEPPPASGRGDRPVGRPFATRAPVMARHGAAATAHPLATQVALDLLRQGGTAVDAAIGANAALGLLEPVGNGIGGDLFALVWDPEGGTLHGLNASGRSPAGRSLAALKARLGERERIPSHGSLAVTVPGAVDGWFELHQRFGRLPMAEILAPAIRYAREGTAVPPLIAYHWAANFERFEQSSDIEERVNARQTFLVDGAPPAEGAIFANPDLAKTYVLLAEKGRDAFYRGEIARTIDAYMRRIGGDLTAEDLAAHASTWVEPVSVDYRGFRVWELPPNTQGVAALQMLQILEGHDLAKMGWGTDKTLHVMIEAKRLAFEDRARYYADPAFAEAPIDGLLSEGYAEQRRRHIGPRARPSVTAGDPRLDDGDTTYLTVADDAGMMVSLIQSNYRGMGSGLVPDGLGFMLQDRGELFSLDPGHANVYAPSKRPFHTIIPAFVTKDGQPWLSFGLMGGGMQPQGHVQIVTNLVDFGMNVQEAGDAARWRHDGSTEPTGAAEDGLGTVLLESGFSEAARRGLQARGHRVRPGRGGFGGYQAIMRNPETGAYHAASEMRKDGQAGGF